MNQHPQLKKKLIPDVPKFVRLGIIYFYADKMFFLVDKAVIDIFSLNFFIISKWVFKKKQTKRQEGVLSRLCKFTKKKKKSNNLL